MSTTEIEKARAAQRAYAKAWRAKNPDKVRDKNLRYWLRRAERETQEATLQEGGETNGTDAAVSKDR